MEDSGNAVVKQAEHKEDIVTAGEDYKEVVEGVLHIVWREDVDREGVAQKSKDCNRDLENVFLYLGFPPLQVQLSAA